MEVALLRREATISSSAAPAARAGRTDRTGRIRVVLAADDFLARQGITHVLQALEGVELAGAYRDLETVLAEVARLRPDVVVTEIRLAPGFADEGIRVATELRVTHPQIGVVVLSDDVEPQHAATLFAEGSYRRAFLLKERLGDAAELERAVTAVAAGGAVVDPRVVDELLSSRYRRERSPLAALTPREAEILSLIADGRANGGIADDLGITKRGVERHVNSIFSKLELGPSNGVSRRVTAALIFLRGDGRLVD